MSEKQEQKFYLAEDLVEFAGWLSNKRKLTTVLNSSLRAIKHGEGTIHVPNHGTYQLKKVKV